MSTTTLTTTEQQCREHEYPRLVADDGSATMDALGAQITTWLDSPRGIAFLGDDHALATFRREAVWGLVCLARNKSTVADACDRVAAVLGILADAPRHWRSASPDDFDGELAERESALARENQ